MNSVLDKYRFLGLIKRCCPGLPTKRMQRIFEDLRARYSEPIRHYHNTAHIAQCLRQHDLAEHLMVTPDAVEMAIWFHDAIYVPGADDNESQSAELFVQAVNDSCDPQLRMHVAKLILVTDHRAAPQSADGALLVDIDLSSFGLPTAAFLRDCRAVRREMTHLSDEAFRVRHCRFLESLLERERLYFTDFFEQRFGERAKSNITRYLADMKAAL